MERCRERSGEEDGMFVGKGGAASLHWQRGARLNSRGVHVEGPPKKLQC